jgi:hypothetical protein
MLCLPQNMRCMMWMYAEIVDAAGTVLFSAQGNVSRGGDLAALAERAIERYTAHHPGRSFLSDAGTADLTIRIGAAEKPHA